MKRRTKKVNTGERTMLDRVGARIFILRQRRGWTLEQAAEAAGMHKNTVARIESGSNCSLEALSRMSRALGSEVSEILRHAQDIVCP